jgi:peptidoglycan hydrolase FlgJ
MIESATAGLKIAPVLPDKNTGSVEQMRDAYKTQRAKLKKATEGFEAIFVTQLLKQAHQSMQGANALFGSSSESKFYAEMRDELLAQQISKTGEFGIGKMLFQKLERTLPPNPDKPDTMTHSAAMTRAQE